VREFRATTGPFKTGIYFSNGEIEQICADELRASGCYPKNPGPIRIDWFIEKRFRVVPRSDDLPPGVLGCTVFGKGSVEEIMISRSLEEDTSQAAWRRSRTTFAHEGGHGLLHAHLFATEDAQQAFADIPDLRGGRILCRDEGLRVARAGSSYDGRWWEYQANQAMTALLLPLDLVESVVQPFLIPSGTLGLKVLDSGKLEVAVHAVAEVFDVNAIVAELRLGALYEPSVKAQMKL
jgi:hypothetical protein